MASAPANPILEALEALAQDLSVTVCYETLPGGASASGGLCRVRGQYRVILDRRLGPGDRISALSSALSRFDLSALELAEPLRPLFAAPAA